MSINIFFYIGQWSPLRRNIFFYIGQWSPLRRSCPALPEISAPSGSGIAAGCPTVPFATDETPIKKLKKIRLEKNIPAHKCLHSHPVRPTGISRPSRMLTNCSEYIPNTCNMNAFLPDGWGITPLCPDCPIRASVNETCTTGQPVTRRPATPAGKSGTQNETVSFHISTQKRRGHCPAPA